MSGECVKVIVRCRPVNERETNLKSAVVIDIAPDGGQVQIMKPAKIRSPGNSGEPKSFKFDAAYAMDSQTELIYEEMGLPLVASILEGYNGTVFAYGQTGCGKSYTMSGPSEPETQKGIIPRAFQHIFDEISVSEGSHYLIQATYLEIYNEEVRDLLGIDVKAKLDLKEHTNRGVYVHGLSAHRVASIQDLERLMDQGGKNRSVGATLMNPDSSRSHSIFAVVVEIADDTGVRSGKLNLVDLAGSERQSKTGSTGERFREATRINLSLSALGNVISALVDGKSKHIPYRDSKLTRLLQSSLGGNTKTLMVACISPADNNYEETLSTLRYANRAKNIKNKPKINEDPKDALIRQYQEEIMRLKQMIEGGGDMGVGIQEGFEDRLEEERARLKREYEEEMNALNDKFKAEHESSERLQQELDQLQHNYNTELSNLANNAIYTVKGENAVSPVNNGEVDVNTVMSQLTELQKQMIGGENKKDDTLKKQLTERKRKAKKRSDKMSIEATEYTDWDSEQVIEGVFQSVTDEVSHQRNRVSKLKTKLNTAHEEISDLQEEFEQERSDYLESVRDMSSQLRLQRLIMDRLASCIRRDCNYYNVDNVLANSRFNEGKGDWELPPLLLEKLILPKTNGVADEYSEIIPTAFDSPTDTHLLDQLNRSESPTENFKPKRANQLVMEATSYIENFKDYKSLNDLRMPGSPKLIAGSAGLHASRNKSISAAKIHGIDVPIGEVVYSRKPYKLEALHLPISNSANDFSTLSHSPDDLIENLPIIQKKFNKSTLNPL
ncbi:Osmotic avoidance abnormal protein 3-like [Oopsacas minuta]|uniref:Kinesin-like protein n=1 Tax=Oopsacas minuta TaxID=111878 RepID=A0AAV7JV01_9METZ|nr:Osmotic avoidance abnormal protein 3-like [Oopsacas minuta]